MKNKRTPRLPHKLLEVRDEDFYEFWMRNKEMWSTQRIADALRVPVQTLYYIIKKCRKIT